MLMGLGLNKLGSERWSGACDGAVVQALHGAGSAPHRLRVHPRRAPPHRPPPPEHGAAAMDLDLGLQERWLLLRHVPAAHHYLHRLGGPPTVQPHRLTPAFYMTFRFFNYVKCQIIPFEELTR